MTFPEKLRQALLDIPAFCVSEPRVCVPNSHSGQIYEIVKESRKAYNNWDPETSFVVCSSYGDHLLKNAKGFNVQSYGHSPNSIAEVAPPFRSLIWLPAMHEDYFYIRSAFDRLWNVLEPLGYFAFMLEKKHWQEDRLFQRLYMNRSEMFHMELGERMFTIFYGNKSADWKLRIDPEDDTSFVVESIVTNILNTSWMVDAIKKYGLKDYAKSFHVVKASLEELWEAECCIAPSDGDFITAIEEVLKTLKERGA